MKKKSIIIISFIVIASLLMLSIVSGFASTILIYEGFSYTELGEDKVSICGWDNRTSDLVIPPMLLFDYVSEISDMAMTDNDYITSVDFSSAYYLEKIGFMAFKGCSSLSGTITIPSGLNSVGLGAFQDCSSIEALHFYASNADIPSQFCLRCNSLEEVNISDGVHVINSYAFANCTQLNKIRIPSSVNSIHSTAFQNCPNLVIYCYTGSYAQQYAEDKGIDYVLIDAPAPTEPPTEAPTDVPTEPVIPTEEPTQAPTAEPTQPVTEAPTQAPVAILGDVDGDGNVSTIDATLMQRYLASVAYPAGCNFAHGDVDGDGTITILDVTYIMRYLASIDVPYPINEPIQNQ